MPDKITKFIEKLDPRLRQRLLETLSKLKSDPYSMTGVKKLSHPKYRYRLRIGKIRIIYRIMQGDVDIVDIDFRGNVY